MTLGELYRRAVAAGMQNDLRGTERARVDLEQARKQFDGLKEPDRPYFDAERLENPYADSRILHGNPDTQLGTILVGIDVDESGVLLADRLRQNGRRLDAVVAHHPSGHALAQLPGVMGIQAGPVPVAGA